ncbi:Uncharacterised protein (plasmid) [Tsukamurella tyrosinosolvens]|nr:hypothetical protein SAMN04489793_5153 [Tsukamurella tyrosinosolvens]VEI01630.1 Uncharacterised protein [Tsukamurella tyrosinosolvens]
MWSPRHADPVEVSGDAFCSAVRHTMRDIWRNDRNDQPGMNLRCGRGQGGGAVFSDLGGTEFRLRKFLSKHLQAAIDREVVLPPEAEQAIASGGLQAEQMNLFAGPGRIPKPAKRSASVDDEEQREHDGIFALWSTTDNTTLESLHLAVVRGVDNPASAEILAVVPFPSAEESPFYGLPAAKPVGAPPADDFGSYDKPVQGTGDEDDDGPEFTPA